MSELKPRKDLNKVILPKESVDHKAGRIDQKKLSKKTAKTSS